MPSQKNTIKNDPIIKELDSVKRLLALFLLKLGSSQGEVGMALDVDQSVVSRMFPSGQVKKFKFID